MKKILFLTPFVPSNRAGGENFTRLLLEQLSFNNKIDLLYYRYADDPIYEAPNENVKVVKEVVNSMFVKLKNSLMHPTMHPIFTIRFNKRILTFVKNLFDKNHYDVLYLDHTQMALYGKFFPSVKKMLMSHDVMAQCFSRKGGFVSKKLILGGEGELMRMPNTTVFTFSEKDRQIIHHYYGLDSKVTNFFLDQSIIEAYPENVANRIVFFGKWKRSDNFDGLLWFFDHCYEKLSKDVTISIIGKWLPEEFESRIKKMKNVEYLGFVENPYPLIANSIATISPIFSGAGVKVKVVESLACGTPTIGNDIAFEGISEDFCDFMVRVNSPEEYVNAIMNLDVAIENRKAFKAKFINLYQSQSICTYIDAL